LETDDGVEVEIQQDASASVSGPSVSDDSECVKYTEDERRGVEILTGRGLGRLKLDRRTLSRIGRSAFTPLRPFKPTPLPRTSIGKGVGTGPGDDMGTQTPSHQASGVMLEELASFLRVQRMGLLLDDSIIPVVRRKAEAFFRKNEVDNVERERLIAAVIPLVFDKNPIESALEGWMKGKKQYHVDRGNLAYKGMRVKPPPFMLRVGWWMGSVLCCFGSAWRKTRLIKWQSKNPVRVFPKTS